MFLSAVIPASVRDELMNRNSVYRAQEAEEKERHACRMDQLAHELMDH